MFDALLMQSADGIGGATQGLGQLFGIGFDQPRANLQPQAQRFAAGVQGHFQPEVFQRLQQTFKPLRADAARQATGHHHRIELRANDRDHLKQRF